MKWNVKKKRNATAKEEEQFDLNDLSVPPGVKINDPVRMYLKEIGRVDLLTGDEEVKLAIGIKEGVEAEEKLAEMKKPDPALLELVEKRRKCQEETCRSKPSSCRQHRKKIRRTRHVIP